MPDSPSRSRGVSAFTLLEIVVALGLLVALTGMALGAIHGLRQRAAVVQTRSELAVLALALESYRSRHGDYPPGDLDAPSGAAALFRALSRGESTRGTTSRRPWVDLGRLRSGPVGAEAAVGTAFLDPWGRSYRYVYRERSGSVPSGTVAAEAAASYVLLSAGPDGLATVAFTTDGVVVSEGAENADNVMAGDGS